jgi:phosphoketolase
MTAGIVAMLMLVGIATSTASAQDRNPTSTSDEKELVRLLVVDGRDIRFLRFPPDDAEAQPILARIVAQLERTSPS